MTIMIRYIAAAAIVLVCSVTDSSAQQQQQRQTTVVNRTVNVYNGGGGYQRYGYGTPGAGPYDSAIAVAGIIAGASVLNNVISSRQQPQVIVQQVPVYQAPVYQSNPAPGCITAMASDGNYYRYCR